MPIKLVKNSSCFVISVDEKLGRMSFRSRSTEDTFLIPVRALVKVKWDTFNQHEKQRFAKASCALKNNQIFSECLSLPK